MLVDDDRDQSEVLIAVYLRDPRFLNVIMALDRLTVFPQTDEELRIAREDLSLVREFITQHLPDSLQRLAKSMFVQHTQAILEWVEMNKEVKQAGIKK